MSETKLYKEDTKESALQFVNYLNIIYKFDKGIYNSSNIGLDEKNDEKRVRFILVNLRKWAKNDELFPFDNPSLGPNEASRVWLRGFLMCLKGYILSQLKVEKFPHLVASSAEGDFTKNNIRWIGHLHPQAINLINDSFVEELLNSQTIVLVADIRKSQDLMTYGPDADFFRDKVLEFTTSMRKIIKSHYGIFDKFTGDGFLCYFNSYLCKKFNTDPYKQLMSACDQIMKFSTNFFFEWSKHIRKLPPNSAGLTLGIDSGIVKFRDLENHLFAIGDAIVWANRMSSSGKKNEIIFNNIPYFKALEKFPNLKFEIFESNTKGGDLFTAYKYLYK